MTYGYQGGDPARQHRHRLDLSGCVNRYGPPQSVLTKLEKIRGEEIRNHPYEAVDQVRKAYCSLVTDTFLSSNELLVGRGTSEFIARLPFVFKKKSVKILFPFYTDFVKVMETNDADYGVLYPTGAGKYPKFNAIKAALEAGNPVIISNPCNPSGEYLSRDFIEELACLAESNDSTLVVDESYIEFSNRTRSTLGVKSSGLVVLQSTAKFYGLGATRVGVLWTRNDALREAFGRGQPSWPVSGLDAMLAEVGLRDSDFKSESVKKMSRDVKRLKMFFLDKGIGISGESVTNFVLITGDDAERVINGARRSNIAVRAFATAHRFGKAAARVAAPRDDEFDIFRDSMNCVL